MPYLVDTSSFVDAKNNWYRFDVCPGFWEWLLIQNQRGLVFSVEAVKDECLSGNDALSRWVRQSGIDLFLPPDNAVVECQKEVCAWVQQQTRFEQVLRSRFIAKADPFLIAHAKVHGFTVVTHESNDPNQLKIPAVCRAHSLPETVSIYQLIRMIGGRFILDPSSTTFEEAPMVDEVVSFDNDAEEGEYDP